MIENVCTTFVQKLKLNDSDIDDERAEVLTFGLVRIIEDTIKFIGIIAIAIWFNIVPITVISIICIALTKTFIGGAHMRTNMACFIVSIFATFGAIILARQCMYIDKVILYSLYLATFIFNIFVVNKYAPADTEEIPILSKKIKKRQKTFAYITVCIFYSTSIFIIKDYEIKHVMLISLLITSLMATPMFYKITKTKYSHECEEFANMDY